MTSPWHLDTAMLAAGNPRGLDGGDPDALPCSPPGPTSRMSLPPITADELAAVRAAAYARLKHPNRKYRPTAPRKADTR